MHGVAPPASSWSSSWQGLTPIDTQARSARDWRCPCTKENEPRRGGIGAHSPLRVVPRRRDQLPWVSFMPIMSHAKRSVDVEANRLPALAALFADALARARTSGLLPNDGT